MAQSDSDFECPPTTGVKQKQAPTVRKGRVKKCARKNTHGGKRHLRLPRRGEGGTAFDDTKFMIPESKRFHCKVQSYNELDVIEDLKNTFTEKQKELFLDTQFGHFLSMPPISFQAQLAHHVLLREVYSDTEDTDFWFKINGIIVRYSIEEFCMITGLKCEGDADTSSFLIKKGGFKDVTFPASSGKVTKRQVRDAFCGKKVEGDENVVKLGIVHLLANFLFGSVYDTKVNNIFWAVVDSDQSLVADFPFGKLLWETSRSSMRKALYEKEKIFDDRFDAKSGKVSSFCYRLLGFPLAFQIWIYESIPSLTPVYCKKIGDVFPRINCWNSGQSVKYNTLDCKVFSNQKLRVVQLEPNVVEREKPILRSFDFKSRFQNCKTKQKFEEKRNEKPNTQSKDKEEKEKQMPEEQSKKKEKMTESFQEKQTGFNQPSYEARFKEIESHMQEIKVDIGEIKSNQEIIIGEFSGFEKKMVEYLRTLEKIAVSVENPVKDTSPPTDEVHTEKEEEEKNNIEKNEVIFETPDNASVNDANCGDKEEEEKNNIEKNEVLFETADHASVNDANCGDKKASSKSDTLENVLRLAERGVAAALQSLSKDKSVNDVEKEQGCNVVDSEATVEGAVKEKRQHKPAAVMKSPFLNEFGSSDAKAEGKRKVNEGDVVKHIIPFEKQLGFNNNDDDLEAYSKWYHEGFKPKTKKKFTPKFRKVALDLGVDFITEKIWFYKLNTCGEFLSDDHLDVVFYYLRKKIKYSGNVDLRVTTTDSLFYQTCKETNTRCPLSDYVKVASISTVITEYILGTYHYCATPWAQVDHVVMPVHVVSDAHFILVHFDIRQRRLVVYNSLRGAAHRRTALEAVEPISVLVPVYLDFAGFYDSRDDLDLTEGPYSVPVKSPLEVVVAEDVPEQEECDCGIFTILFADHIIHNTIKDFKGKVNIAKFRDEICICLYNHAMRKQQDGYCSANEKPLKKKQKI